MKFESAQFMFSSKVPKEQLEPGISRQILGHNDNILMARVWFDTGAVGQVHAHPHSQVTYIEKGVFDFSIGKDMKRMEAGDCVYIPPDTDHGAVCIEPGILLDVFSPSREDFLTKSEQL